MEQLGSTKTITITKDDTLMLDGAGTAEAIEERCQFIRDAIEASNSEYEKDKLKERLAKISGGVAVIKVGGASEVEVNEVKDRLNDVLNATQAALEEGIVPGGGSALLRAIPKLDALKLDNLDQQVGVDAIKAALKTPCIQIARNAGEEGAVVVREVMASQDPGFGFDAATGQYVNMLEKGIIDPTKVVRTAVADAVSVAALMTTTEAVVADEVEIPDVPFAGGPTGPIRTSMPKLSGLKGF